jgi:hypothetical protein
MIARGALNLFPGQLIFALHALLAVRAGEFEFAHNLLVFIPTANAVALQPLRCYVRISTPKRFGGLVKNA